MLDFDEKNILSDEESFSNEKRDSILFDQTDKPFLLLYLIIFILGIILTILAI